MPYKNYILPLRKNCKNMKRVCFIFIGLMVFINSANSLENSIKQELNTLEFCLSERTRIEAEKRVRIDSLSRAASFERSAYKTYKSLYEEYRSYNYDTALIFVDFMEHEAASEQLDEVRLCRAFVYLSGGLFKEASDLLEQGVPSDTSLLMTYYLTYARLMWDMADRVSGSIRDEYNEKGVWLCHKMLDCLSEQDTAQLLYGQAVTDLREGFYKRGIERCKLSLAARQPSVHYQAITESTLGYLYRITGDNSTALHYYIKAAICDIRSSTFETVAMRNIAELLFEMGETDLADRYIRIAMHDAQRYHAQHRQMDIAQSLPIIEEKMFSRIQHQQRMAWLLLMSVAMLLFVGIGGIIVLVRQNKTVHTARLTINQMNQSLTEANTLKEELLGTLLTSRSQYINAVQQYQQDVRKNAINRQWNELLSVPKSADAKQQRIVLDRQIDTIVLGLFPNFVKDVNALLRSEEQLILKKEELLNAQLRIFALIRLGIIRNEEIAEILNYSINTVYSYKTRVIAASYLSQEDFYAALMKIPSFSKK